MIIDRIESRDKQLQISYKLLKNVFVYKLTIHYFFIGEKTTKNKKKFINSVKLIIYNYLEKLFGSGIKKNLIYLIFNKLNHISVRFRIDW